ncbi:MAG: IS630 family transposase [Burkholderiaceae bacterium]|nr:IS630 family transposase [Burkholderiaceae bacterium]
MQCKKTIDARSYSHDMLEQLRRDAVKRVESGESPEAVASGLGINRRTIYRWLSAFHYGGDQALAAKPIPGAPPKLDAKQLAKLARLIRDRNPQQLKFDYALWTLAIIRQVIANRFMVKLSEVSVARLMKRLGFTPQRPLYRAWQQDPVLAKRWQDKDYPKIAARAKKDNALIFFADEAGIRSDNHAGTTWAPVGQTPIVKATGARFGFNMLSAVNAQGHFRFMTVEGTVTASVFRDFLKRLITGVERKVFLIVDGHPTHKAKLVKQFLADNKDRIELFFLPPYSPELNPDELVWNNVKARVAKMAVMTKEEMKVAADSALRRIQKLPELVANFFRTSTCMYAAG